ncbi:MAG: DUF3515 domain-containing protein [Rhodoglobus sp.]
MKLLARARLAPIALTGAALALVLSGCSNPVPLQPADDAINPACAAVVVRLPDTVSGLDARATNAQGTGAWGTPASIILRCGVPVPAPTAVLPCVTVDGIDWLRDDSGDPHFVFTTYGREPAVEVIVDADAASGLEALTDLSYAVGFTERVGECITPGG